LCGKGWDILILELKDRVSFRIDTGRYLVVIQVEYRVRFNIYFTLIVVLDRKIPEA
jgi:hypothetical protein